MKSRAAVTFNDIPVPEIVLSRGETLEEEVVWLNSDGTARSMDLATVTVRCSTYPGGVSVQGFSYGPFTDSAGVTSSRLLLSRTASEALSPGRYRIELLETRESPEPDTVAIARIELRVKP